MSLTSCCPRQSMHRSLALCCGWPLPYRLQSCCSGHTWQCMAIYICAGKAWMFLCSTKFVLRENLVASLRLCMPMLCVPSLVIGAVLASNLIEQWQAVANATGLDESLLLSVPVWENLQVISCCYAEGCRYEHLCNHLCYQCLLLLSEMNCRAFDAITANISVLIATFFVF